MVTAMILIKLGKCPGLFESLLGGSVTLLVMANIRSANSKNSDHTTQNALAGLSLYCSGYVKHLFLSYNSIIWQSPVVKN